jgi:tRNA(fMet)-specific endonuclease VapC
VIDLIQRDRPDPPPIATADTIILPLPVMGELLAGAYGSRFVDEGLRALEVTSKWELMLPDLETAHVYGQLRGQLRFRNVSPSKVNDLWIAALCIQHDLPLLARDGGFESIPGLTVLHW